jgi:hypothetical protein
MALPSSTRIAFEQIGDHNETSCESVYHGQFCSLSFSAISNSNAEATKSEDEGRLNVVHRNGVW